MGFLSGLFGKKKSFNETNDFMVNGQPRFIGGNTFLNGRNLASTSFNRKTKTVDTKLDFDPQDLKASDTSKKGVADLSESIFGAINPSEENKQRYINALYEPQKAKLMDVYNNELGMANNAAAARGVRSSAGFENFRANQLDKNLGQGLSDIYNQSLIQSYDLPSMQLQPIMQGLAAYNDIQDSIMNRNMALIDPSFQGSQLGMNYANNRTNAAMNAYNSQSFTPGVFSNGLIGKFLQAS